MQTVQDGHKIMCYDIIMAVMQRGYSFSAKISCGQMQCIHKIYKNVIEEAVKYCAVYFGLYDVMGQLDTIFEKMKYLRTHSLAFLDIL